MFQTENTTHSSTAWAFSESEVSMTRQSLNPSSHRRSLSKPMPSLFNEPDDLVLVLRVAIHHPPQPAAFLGSNPLQRLQVLLAAPGEKIEFDSLNMKTGAPPQLLPPMPPEICDFQRPPRLVQGEILSDDDGRLYERFGYRIRPLKRLCSGPRGEVLELPAEAETASRHPESPAPAEPQRSTVRQPDLKTAIPERWIKPWEFQISREEAMYDMQLAPSFRSRLAALFGNRKSWRKWQALLTGKSLDEQLWAVRPPRGRLAQPTTREWARKTLGEAGYDAKTMVAEWEIFWRRKGL